MAAITAGRLLIKPGELTRRYLAGHRVPYGPPSRLYGFVDFMIFFLLSLNAGQGANAHGKDGWLKRSCFASKKARSACT